MAEVQASEGTPRMRLCHYGRKGYDRHREALAIWIKKATHECWKPLRFRNTGPEKNGCAPPHSHTQWQKDTSVEQIKVMISIWREGLERTYTR